MLPSPEMAAIMSFSSSVPGSAKGLYSISFRVFWPAMTLMLSPGSAEPSSTPVRSSRHSTGQESPSLWTLTSSESGIIRRTPTGVYRSSFGYSGKAAGRREDNLVAGSLQSSHSLKNCRLCLGCSLYGAAQEI